MERNLKNSGKSTQESKIKKKKKIEIQIQIQKKSLKIQKFKKNKKSIGRRGRFIKAAAYTNKEQNKPSTKESKQKKNMYIKYQKSKIQIKIQNIHIKIKVQIQIQNIQKKSKIQKKTPFKKQKKKYAHIKYQISKIQIKIQNIQKEKTKIQKNTIQTHTQGAGAPFHETAAHTNKEQDESCCCCYSSWNW